MENPEFSPHNFKRSQTITHPSVEINLLSNSPGRENLYKIASNNYKDIITEENEEEFISQSSKSLEKCSPVSKNPQNAQNQADTAKDKNLPTIPNLAEFGKIDKNLRRASHRVPNFAFAKFSESESENFSDGSESSCELIKLKSMIPTRTHSANARTISKPKDDGASINLSTKLTPDLSGLFFNEEMLVLYYVSVGIRLCKLSDCRKAIKEYSKKENLSSRARGHLYQFQGLLALMSSKANLEQIESSFKNAIYHYDKAKCYKGKAICKLGILKTKLEFNPLSPVKRATLSKSSKRTVVINQIRELRNSFESISFDLGLQCLQKIEDSLETEKINHQPVPQKFMRFKTLNSKYITELSQEDNHLNQKMLFNEDIILFTTVVEKDPKIIKKSASCSKFVQKSMLNELPVISISIFAEEGRVVLNSSSFDASALPFGEEKHLTPGEPVQRRIQRHKKNLKKFAL